MDAGLLSGLNSGDEGTFHDALSRAETLLAGADLAEAQVGSVVRALERRLRRTQDASASAAILASMSRVLSSPAGVSAAAEITGVLGAAVALTASPRLRSPVARLVTALVVQAGTIDATAAILFRRGLDSHDVSPQESVAVLLQPSGLTAAAVATAVVSFFSSTPFSRAPHTDASIARCPARRDVFRCGGSPGAHAGPAGPCFGVGQAQRIADELKPAECPPQPASAGSQRCDRIARH